MLSLIISIDLPLFFKKSNDSFTFSLENETCNRPLHQYNFLFLCYFYYHCPEFFQNHSTKLT